MPRVSVTVPGLAPQPYRFPLDRELVTLGRGADNDIVIDSGSVSTRHAEMVRVHGGYELRDVGSTNGIHRGDEWCTVIGLINGEVLQVGDVDFHFTLTPEEEAELQAEEQPQVQPEMVAPVAVNLVQASEPMPAAVPQQATPAPQRVAPQPVVYAAPRAAAEMAPALCVVLAVLAFAGGLAWRHQKETGKSLLDGSTPAAPGMQSPAQPAKQAASGEGAETGAAPAQP